MSRVAALALLVAALGPLAPTGSADDGVGERVAENVERDTTWSGVVRLERRIRVEAGATLRIAAGARIVVPAFDGPSVDVKARYVPGIEVSGSLVAEGAADAPIRFGPPPESPASRGAGRPLPVWFGIVVLPVEKVAADPRPAPHVDLFHALFERAFVAVQAGRSKAVLRSCAFHDCTAGVEVGELWESYDRRIGPAGDVAPRLEDCRFGGCRVGVAVEGKGRPTIERSLFAGCALGLGNEGPFQVIHPLEGLGPRADRCEFVRCVRAVYGASYVTNSIFEWNEVVFQATRLHDEYTTQIDRYVRVRNLYGPAQRLTRSDVPMGEGALLAPPARRGRLDFPVTVETLLGDLAPTLQLKPGSPGCPIESGGADVGIFARPDPPPASRPEAPLVAGLVVDHWLAAGPPDSTRDVDVGQLAKSIGAKPRFAGNLDGKFQWAIVGPETFSDPGADRLAFGNGHRTRILLATFNSLQDAGAVLRLAWDGTLSAWWNGQPLPIPSGGRRFRPDDVSVPLVRLPGTNVLLLRHTPRESSSRLSVRLLDQLRQQGPPAALETAPPAKATGRAPPTLAIQSVVCGNPGLNVDYTELVVALNAPVNWIDASSPSVYTVVDNKGRPFLSDPPQSFVRYAEYMPSKNTVHVFCLHFTFLPNELIRVTISGIRTPDGSVTYPPVTATFKVQ